MVQQPHISNAFLHRIQFAVCGVQSPLLTAFLLVSLPAGTKTFQFPAFPDLSVSKAKSHSEISGSIPAYGSPELIAVSHFLRRRLKPSPSPMNVIPLTFLTQTMRGYTLFEHKNPLARIFVTLIS